MALERRLGTLDASPSDSSPTPARPPLMAQRAPEAPAWPPSLPAPVPATPAPPPPSVAPSSATPAPATPSVQPSPAPSSPQVAASTRRLGRVAAMAAEPGAHEGRHTGTHQGTKEKREGWRCSTAKEEHMAHTARRRRDAHGTTGRGMRQRVGGGSGGIYTGRPGPDRPGPFWATTACRLGR
jgi:hypothetical protein